MLLYACILTGKEKKTLDLDPEIIKYMLEAREAGHSMKVRYGKALLVGSSAAGKSSFFRLLMKEDFEQKHISTGLADSHQLTFATKVDVTTNDNNIEFIALDLDKEIDELRSHLPSSRKDSEAILQEEPIHSSEEDNASNQTAIEGTEKKLTSVELNSIAVKKDMPKKPVKDVWDVLTFIDSGGQPQYISMLPAINSSAMITFVVYNMRGGVDGLNRKVIVTCGDKDGHDKFKPYSINCTNLELIKTLMASTNDTFVRRNFSFLDKLRVKEDDQSRDEHCEISSCLSFIGTHQDEVTPKVFSDINKTLCSTVRDCKVHNVWFPKLNTCLISVDNTTARKAKKGRTKTEVQEVVEDSNAALIRNKIFRLIEKQDKFEIPIVWMILELEIRRHCMEKKCKLIPYSDVKKLCEEKGLSNDDRFIKNGLKVHHLFGVILYYEEVDDMCDIVITDHQWLLEKLTDIVCHSFDFDDTMAHEDFKCKGIFNEELLEKIDLGSEDIKKSGIDVKVFNFKKAFLNLLQYLRIISPVQDNGVIRYFMPSLLGSCDPDSLEEFFVWSYGMSTIDNGGDKIEPLLIQLALPSPGKSAPDKSSIRGVFPRGVFCCLIAELMQKRSDWLLQCSRGENEEMDGENLGHLDNLSSRLEKIEEKQNNEMFINLVTFYMTQNQCYVTLIDRIFFLEIQIRNKKSVCPAVCYETKSVIEDSLKHIGELLYFRKFSLMYGFSCRHRTCSAREIQHITMESSENKKLYLCQNNKPTELERSHTVWLEQEGMIILFGSSICKAGKISWWTIFF